jgi:hypothetical protein
LIVALMLETAAEFSCMSMFARLVLRAPTGLLSLPSAVLAVTLGGRLLTQSCTRRETLGLERRFCVFFDEGLEVMMMVGPSGSCCERLLEGAGVGRLWGGR